MNIVAVVIWYNPEYIVLNNIKTYCRFFNKIFIIDNSDVNNSDLAKEIPNAEYYSCGTNLGIAKALNIGCSKAYKEGYNWCITMDQDSYFSENVVEKYIKLVEVYNKTNKQYGSFTPSLDLKPTNMYDLFIKLIKPIYKKFFSKSKEREVSFCITSGNIINLEVWKKLDGFDSDLFIDGVDIDFSIRLRKIGYKILQIRTINLHHSLGDFRFTFFRKDTHSDFRLYYMIRNSLYIQEKHPEEKEYFQNQIKKLYKDKCVFSFHRKKHLEIFQQAKNDSNVMIKKLKCNNI